MPRHPACGALGYSRPAMMPGSAPHTAVLDTNVVLDWLWFDDARVRELALRVRGGTLHWCGTASMREELVAVLGRGSLPARTRTPAAVLADYDRWCTPHPGPLPTRAWTALRCTDGDDQKFIDLALTLAGTGGGAMLLSRDRAVLRLARRARAHGLWIGPPERWCDPADPQANGLA